MASNYDVHSPPCVIRQCSCHLATTRRVPLVEQELPFREPEFTSGFYIRSCRSICSIVFFLPWLSLCRFVFFRPLYYLSFVDLRLLSPLWYLYGFVILLDLSLVSGAGSTYTVWGKKKLSICQRNISSLYRYLSLFYIIAVCIYYKYISVLHVKI